MFKGYHNAKHGQLEKGAAPQRKQNTHQDPDACPVCRLNCARASCGLKREGFRSGSKLRKGRVSLGLGHRGSGLLLAGKGESHSTSTNSRITAAFRAVASRYPSAQEAELIRSTLDQHLTAYKAKPDSAKLAITYGESKPNEKLDPADPADLAAWTMVTNLLLNLDEMVTRG